ncbi:unnamed protein product [Amoebophrya sp. A120]|nr:unnamed protein product [Amoebophrya sp. A120]|eukprot:GSA120T00022720001.1
MTAPSGEHSQQQQQQPPPNNMPAIEDPGEPPSIHESQPRSSSIHDGTARSSTYEHPEAVEDVEDVRTRFKTLPPLHPHEVELRVPVTELSRPIAPEKFRSKIESVGGFVFGLLIFPRGTKSGRQDNTKDTRWISAFVEARPSEDYPPNWYFQDVQFLVSLINHGNISNSIVKHDKHTFSPTESSDGKAIDRGWHDFVSCDEATLRNGGFVDPRDDTVCFRASVYLAGGPMKVNTPASSGVGPNAAVNPFTPNTKARTRYTELQKWHCGDPIQPTFINSLCQIWFHLGAFRNLIYQTDVPMLKDCARGLYKQMQAAEMVEGVPGRRKIFDIRYPGKRFMKITNVLNNKKSDPDNPAAADMYKDGPEEFVDYAVGSSLILVLREVFARLQHRQGPASAARVASVVSFQKSDLEGTVHTMFDYLLKELECGKDTHYSSSKRASPLQLYHGLQRFLFEVEWSETPLCGPDKKKNSWKHTSPIFPLLTRGFRNLEHCLDHYFSAKVLDDGDGSRVQAKRTIKRLPPVLTWSLKRGGVGERFDFPRVMNMAKYLDASYKEGREESEFEYALYAVLVEYELPQSVRHYAYIRPEMEGDQGQWYRFADGPTDCVHAVPSATVFDASSGGQEWLCVNYLYGPGAVLTRPKATRAKMLFYIRTKSCEEMLTVPKVPRDEKIKVHQLPAITDGPKKDDKSKALVDAEERARSLIEEDEEDAKRLERKKAQRAKKKKKKNGKEEPDQEEESQAVSAAKPTAVAAPVQQSATIQQASPMTTTSSSKQESKKQQTPANASAQPKPSPSPSAHQKNAAAPSVNSKSTTHSPSPSTDASQKSPNDDAKPDSESDSDFGSFVPGNNRFLVSARETASKKNKTKQGTNIAGSTAASATHAPNTATNGPSSSKGNIGAAATTSTSYKKPGQIAKEDEDFVTPARGAAASSKDSKGEGKNKATATAGDRNKSIKDPASSSTSGTSNSKQGGKDHKGSATSGTSTGSEQQGMPNIKGSSAAANAAGALEQQTKDKQPSSSSSSIKAGSNNSTQQQGNNSAASSSSTANKEPKEKKEGKKKGANTVMNLFSKKGKVKQSASAAKDASQSVNAVIAAPQSVHFVAAIGVQASAGATTQGEMNKGSGGISGSSSTAGHTASSTSTPAAAPPTGFTTVVGNSSNQTSKTTSLQSAGAAGLNSLDSKESNTSGASRSKGLDHGTSGNKQAVEQNHGASSSTSTAADLSSLPPTGLLSTATNHQPGTSSTKGHPSGSAELEPQLYQAGAQNEKEANKVENKDTSSKESVTGEQQEDFIPAAGPKRRTRGGKRRAGASRGTTGSGFTVVATSKSGSRKGSTFGTEPKNDKPAVPQSVELVAKISAVAKTSTTNHQPQNSINKSSTSTSNNTKHRGSMHSITSKEADDANKVVVSQSVNALAMKSSTSSVASAGSKQSSRVCWAEVSIADSTTTVNGQPNQQQQQQMLQANQQSAATASTSDTAAVDDRSGGVEQVAVPSQAISEPPMQPPYPPPPEYQSYPPPPPGHSASSGGAPQPPPQQPLPQPATSSTSHLPGDSVWADPVAAAYDYTQSSSSTSQANMYSLPQMAPPPQPQSCAAASTSSCANTYGGGGASTSSYNQASWHQVQHPEHPPPPLPSLSTPTSGAVNNSNSSSITAMLGTTSTENQHNYNATGQQASASSSSCCAGAGGGHQGGHQAQPSPASTPKGSATKKSNQSSIQSTSCSSFALSPGKQKWVHFLDQQSCVGATSSSSTFSSSSTGGQNQQSTSSSQQRQNNQNMISEERLQITHAQVEAVNGDTRLYHCHLYGRTHYDANGQPLCGTSTCGGIAVKPLILPNGALVSLSCFCDYVRGKLQGQMQHHLNQSGEFVLHCPVTGAEISPEDIGSLEQKSPIMYRCYSSLQIRCALAHPDPCNCQWRGSLIEYFDHVRTCHPELFQRNALQHDGTSSGTQQGNVASSYRGQHNSSSSSSSYAGAANASGSTAWNTGGAASSSTCVVNTANGPVVVPPPIGNMYSTSQQMQCGTSVSSYSQHMGGANALTSAANNQATSSNASTASNAMAPPLPSPLPARGELNGWGALEANMPIAVAGTVSSAANEDTEEPLTKGGSSSSSSRPGDLVNGTLEAGTAYHQHAFQPTQHIWGDRQARGDMEALHDWEDPDTQTHVSVGDRMKVQAVDDSGEWAYAGRADHSANPTWIPRSILQHIVYTTRNTYNPESCTPSMLPITAGDKLFAYYHDASGWTFGEKLNPNSEAPGPEGWYPTSLLTACAD